MEYFSSKVARQEEKRFFLSGVSLAEKSEVFLSSKKTDTYFV